MNNKKKCVYSVVILLAILIGIVSGVFLTSSYYDIRISLCEKKYNDSKSDTDLLKLTDVLVQSNDIKYIKYLDALLLVPKDLYETELQEMIIEKYPDFKFDTEIYNEDCYHALMISYALSLCSNANEVDVFRELFFKYYPQVKFSYHIYVLDTTFTIFNTNNNYFMYDNRNMIIEVLNDIYNAEVDAQRKYEYLTTICAFYDAEITADSQKQIELYERLENYKKLFKYSEQDYILWNTIYDRDIDMWNTIIKSPANAMSSSNS